MLRRSFGYAVTCALLWLHEVFDLAPLVADTLKESLDELKDCWLHFERVYLFVFRFLNL